MAFVRQIEYGDATGELKELYDFLVEVAGGVPNIVKLSSLKPAAASAAQNLYQSVLYHESGLTMKEKEMVATLVSALNDATYGVDHHGHALSELTGAPDLTARITTDYRKASISEREMLILELADKLTRAPGSIEEADIDAARGQA